MGQLLSIIPEAIKAANCSDCAKYVCNAMHIHSKCSERCECDIETEEIAVHEQIQESDLKSHFFNNII